MKYLVLTFFITTLAVSLKAQDFKEYRSSNNPYYWQNRKPDPSYWQQDVHYKIDANIDETSNIIDANEKLEYWNNSPDTLTYVYFHLYQNAFVKGSYLHDLEKEQGVNAKLGKYEAAGLGTVVEHMRVDGQEAHTELDNTVLKVYLGKPLYPNRSVTFSMNFKTYYDNGSTRRRMQMWDSWGFTHYNGVQWFPKMCVYDRKFGWDTYQHMNKEFYGEFGVFDVSLNFPSNYIVEATGVLQNRKDVLPDDLRAKLDVKNFAKKPWDEKPSIIIPYVKGERKTWKFHAENVHDFAFTADPSYRISTTYWNGIECVGLVMEPHASGWQNSSALVAKIVETFSKDVGMFAYPKMVAADARDGMEYPMLTLDGGSSPGYDDLLVHEIGHNWFYGMVGNNETYRASLDEGFTQFLTSWGMNKIDGKYYGHPPKSKYKKRFYEPILYRDARVVNPYLFSALNGETKPLNTHSNDFNDALGHEGGYGLVYFKTATMLYNLQYTLGDSLFLEAFQHYFSQWKFAHPYFDDFRNSIMQFTHVDLNWFFDEWLETTKTMDYSVEFTSKIPGKDSFLINFKRGGQMQMPIDFTVTAKNGNKQSYYIPNTWFTKKTDAIVLPKWYGWSKINSNYQAKVYVPSGLKSVEIDTSGRLADIYQLDNSLKRGSFFNPLTTKIKWDGGLKTNMDQRHFNIYVRPDLWWNPVDGIKLGAHAEGNYMNTMHRFDMAVWWNTHLLQDEEYKAFSGQKQYDRFLPFNFTINYVSPVSINNPHLETQFNYRVLDGLVYARLGNNWKPNDKFLAEFYFQGMNRQLSNDLNYLNYPNEWSSNKTNSNNSLNIVLSRRAQVGNASFLTKITLRAPFLTGNDTGAFNYSYAEYCQTMTTHIDKLELRTRIFGRLGTGTKIPYESELWISGANPEEQMDDKYSRTVGFIPDNWKGISQYEPNHYQMGGGLNLRGYSGYFVADQRNGKTLIGYKGRSGASFNVELGFDRYIKLQPKLTKNWLHVDAYGFADGGVIELSSINNLNQYYDATPTDMWSDFRMDAGLGCAFTIKHWGMFEKAKPLTIRFDMPLFLNRPPYANPQYFNFRYVIGINRAF